MTFTYVDPTNSDRDRVRFLVGDTDTVNAANQHLQDAEITWLLSEWVDVYGAAIAACEQLAIQFSSKADNTKKVGDFSISTQYSGISAQYHKAAEKLRQTRMLKNPPGFVVNADSLLATVDRSLDNAPITDFRVGQFDNQRTGVDIGKP